MDFWSNVKQWDLNNKKRGVVVLWREIINVTQRRKGAKVKRIPPLHHSTTPPLHHTTTPILQIFLLAFVILSFASCQTNEDKLKVLRVEGISYKMEETAKVYFEIDTLKIDSLYSVILFNLDRLGKLGYQDDHKLIMDYATLKKGFKEFIKRRPYTIEELEFCRNQIEDLREDAENGLLSDEDFELYLKHESNASQSLRVQMSYYESRIAAQVKKFENLNPQINSLIDSLNIK